MNQYLSLRLIRASCLIIVGATALIAAASWQYRPNAWTPETQVTNVSGNSRLVDLGADASGRILYLTWEDYSGGVQEVYFQRSLDDGLTWNAPLRLSHLTVITTEPEPRLATNGRQVMVFYANRTASGQHLFYAESDDWGTDFSVPLQVTYESGDQLGGTAAVVSSTVYLVWQQDSSGAVRVYFAKSSNSGRTWSSGVALANDSATQDEDQYPAIAAVDNDVFVAWSRMYEGEQAIFVRTSLDFGGTWRPEVQVSSYAAESYPEFPAIASDGIDLFLVWGSSMGLLYSRSSDEGETWSKPIFLTDMSRQYVAPRITAANSRIQVVVAGIHDLTSNIFYLNSPDDGQTWNASRLTTHSPTALSLAPVVSSNGEDTFVAWEDNRNGNFSIFYRSRPDFRLLRDFEWRILTPVIFILTTTAVVYPEFESRQSKRIMPKKAEKKKISLRMQ